MSAQKVWLWIGIVSGLVVSIILMKYVHPPSFFIGASSADASEWLSWFSLLGLGIAIWQLVKTVHASKASAQASRETLATVARFDVSLAVNSAIGHFQNAIDHFMRPDFPSAQTSCDALLDVLARLKPLQAQLPAGAQEELANVILQVSSSQSAARRGVKNDLDDDLRDNVVTTMQEQKRIFLAIETQLRAHSPLSTNQ